jgi:hypothetical protein
MSIIDGILKLKEKHRETWHDKSDAFWLAQFLEEIAELILSIHGKHNHSPDVELRQIASICLNWLEMREQLNSSKN